MSDNQRGTLQEPPEAGEPQDPDSQKDGLFALIRSLFKTATDAVPAVKYAVGVGGMLGVVALVYILRLSPLTAILGLIVLFIFMGVLVIFARVAALEGSVLAKPAFVFTWFTLVIFMAGTILLFTSAYFNQPLPFRDELFRKAAPPTPLPIIPNADSGWQGGGSSPAAFCNPQFAAMQAKYPDLNIRMMMLPEQHDTEYNPFKHDIYRYTCAFEAARK